MDQIEQRLQTTSRKSRDMQLAKLKHYSDQKQDYHKKVAYIEGNVEKDLLYFEQANQFM